MQRHTDLFTRDEVAELLYGRERELQDGWLLWVSRAAAEIARDADADPQKILAALDRLVQKHLDQLDAMERPF